MELKIYFYFILVVAATWAESSFVSQSTSAEAAADAAMFAHFGNLVSNLTTGGADLVDDLGASYDEFVMESEISHVVLLTNGILKQVTKTTGLSKKPSVTCGQLGYRNCLPRPNPGPIRHCRSAYDRTC